LTFVAIDGDGGTYDIGLQSLGSQRSSATPLGADTPTRLRSVKKGWFVDWEAVERLTL